MAPCFALNWEGRIGGGGGGGGYIHVENNKEGRRRGRNRRGERKGEKEGEEGGKEVCICIHMYMYCRNIS